MCFASGTEAGWGECFKRLFKLSRCTYCRFDPVELCTRKYLSLGTKYASPALSKVFLAKFFNVIKHIFELSGRLDLKLTPGI